MAYGDNQGGSRQMYQGNWTCSQCGGAITELPFEPREDGVSTLKCRECYRNSSGGNRGGGAPRQMHQGSWTCSKCGGEITELPFEPDPDRLDSLQCRECHKQSRPQY
jgi:CxxC-x17-CxxC domain-containing protein